MSDQKHVLVTGGTGFVGSHLAKRLSDLGHIVHVTERAQSSHERVIGLDLIHHQIDLADSAKVALLLEEIKPCSIFHLGANLHQRGIDPPVQSLVDTNIVTTEMIYQYALKTGAHVVFAGTFSEYRPTNQVVNEESVLEPQEMYSLTKMVGTLRAKQLGKEGANIIALRMFTPYGPNMREGKLVRNAIEAALQNEPIKLSGASITRDFIYIDDLVDLYIAADKHAETNRGAIVNAGSGIATTLKEFAELVKELSDSSSEIVFNTTSALSYDGELWQADISKAKNLLNWVPENSIRQGMQKTIKSYANKVT